MQDNTIWIDLYHISEDLYIAVAGCLLVHLVPVYFYGEVEEICVDSCCLPGYRFSRSDYPETGKQLAVARFLLFKGHYGY